jgi:hypothetical protein
MCIGEAAFVFFNPLDLFLEQLVITRRRPVPSRDEGAGRRSFSDRAVGREPVLDDHDMQLRVPRPVG